MTLIIVRHQMTRLLLISNEIRKHSTLSLFVAKLNRINVDGGVVSAVYVCPSSPGLWGAKEKSGRFKMAKLEDIATHRKGDTLSSEDNGIRVAVRSSSTSSLTNFPGSTNVLLAHLELSAVRHCATQKLRQIWAI